MTVNCVDIGREVEYLITANIILLVRFNKTREIFHSVTRVLIILLTTAATSASVERLNSRACTKDSMFDSGCQLCAEVSSLQQ